MELSFGNKGDRKKERGSLRFQCSDIKRKNSHRKRGMHQLLSGGRGLFAALGIRRGFERGKINSTGRVVQRVGGREEFVSTNLDYQRGPSIQWFSANAGQEVEKKKKVLKKTSGQKTTARGSNI